MKRLLTSLTNPKVAISIGFVFLILLVIFAGPLLDVENWLTRWTVWGVVAFVALLWIFVLWAQSRHEKQRGAQMHRSIREQAEEETLSVKPGVDDETRNEIKRKFDEAIEGLKKSKLGISGLYVLPWYMFIGPPGAGKTTAIKKAELDYSILDESGEGLEVKGEGGTRNCDWWFTNEAIMLDTAGKWMESENQPTWLAFLDFLKKYRSKKPINGVMVGISIKELMEAGEKEIDELARRIRDKIDQLVDKLGVVFPVYLIFTKCDLLHGFVKFFGDLLEKDERGKIFGHTLTKEQWQNPKPETVFDSGFAALYDSLLDYRLNRLATAKEVDKAEVYTFPVQFGAAQKKLSQFVARLFRHDAYREQPIFRGFYFSCGTQEGRPLDLVIEKLRNELGERSGRSIFKDFLYTEPEAKEKKSYFLTDLFQQVIFPDKLLAHPSKGAKRRAFYLGIATSVVAVLALIGFGILVIQSGGRNEAALQKLKPAVENVIALQSNGQPNAEDLYNLDDLSQQLDKGIPLSLGINVREKVKPSAQQLYFARAKPVFLDTVGKYLAKELDQRRPELNWLEMRDLLKTYLLFTEFNQNNRTCPLDDQNHEFFHQRLGAIIETIWGKPNGEKWDQWAARQMNFYQRHLNEDSPSFYVKDDDLINEARDWINRRRDAGPKGKYDEIIRRANAGRDSLRLEEMVGKHKMVLIGAVGNQAIPYGFTAEGWEFIKNEIDEAKKRPKPDCAMGETSEQVQNDEWTPEVMEQELRRLYFQDYVATWKRFLENVRLAPCNDLHDASSALEKLAGKESPLEQLFFDVAENVLFDVGMKEKGKELKAKVEKAAGRGNRRMKAVMKRPHDKPKNPVEEEFWSIVQFATVASDAPASAEPLITQYRSKITSLADKLDGLSNNEEAAFDLAKASISPNPSTDFDKVIGWVRQQSTQFGEEEWKLVQPLLEAPVKESWAFVLKQAQKYINQQWENEVYEAFAIELSLANRYPLNPDPGLDDATQEDFEKFFSPSGKLWKFFDDHLKDFFSGNDFSVKSGEYLPSLKFEPSLHGVYGKAEQFKDNLFESDALRIKFYLVPTEDTGKIRQASSRRVDQTVIEIDGENLVYQFGNESRRQHERQLWTWPGSGGSPGAKVDFTIDGRRVAPSIEASGVWGLLRILSLAKHRNPFTWVFPNEDQTITVEVKYQLKPAKIANLFQNREFFNFRCPQKICPEE